MGKHVHACIYMCMHVIHSHRAALAAAAATLGSTTEARKATVDMTGLPCWLNGIGWYASGPLVMPGWSSR